MVNNILLITLMICLITDLKTRTIYNIITFPVILLGILICTLTDGWQGFLFSVEGMLLGVGVMLIPFLFGGMGAGDVKLLASVGALKGSMFVFTAFIYTSVIGGLIALGVLIAKKQLILTLRRLSLSFIPGYGIAASSGAITIPYGVAIVAGTILVYVWSGF